MLQLIGLILISWLIIWLFAKGNLSVLGLAPTTERLKYFAILFFASGIISASAFFLRMFFAQEVYTLTPSLTIGTILIEIWYQFRTVMTEELFAEGLYFIFLSKKLGRQNLSLLLLYFLRFCIG